MVVGGWRDRDSRFEEWGDGVGWQVNRDGEGGLCSNFRATLAFQQIKVRSRVMFVSVVLRLNESERQRYWQTVRAERSACGLVR
jgi:hypothetical protein